MRKFNQIAVFAVVIAASVAQVEAQEVWRWAKNLDEARTLAAETNRLVLVHFGANNCAPCQRLEKEVFAQQGFGQSLVSEYVGVKVNADLYPATARQFGVESWPTDVIITPDGEVVERITSPRTNAGYTATMAQIAADQGHRRAVADSPYHRPVVSYGAVRSTAPPVQAAAAPAPAIERYTANPAVQPSVMTQQQPQRDRYADFYAQQTQGQASAPPQQNQYRDFPTNASPVAPTATAPAQDRYADFYASQQATAVAPQAPTYAAQQPLAAPSAATMQAGPVTVNPYSNGPAAPAAPRATISQDQLPAGAAPLALDGHCPITLVEQQRWVPGDVRWGITHEGRTYLFSSAADRDKFWQAPHRFSPVMAGNDPVLATDHGQMLAGRREHGLFVNGRVYLFVNEDSLAQFERNRDRYVQSVNRTLR